MMPPWPPPDARALFFRRCFDASATLSPVLPFFARYACQFYAAIGCCRFADTPAA